MFNSFLRKAQQVGSVLFNLLYPQRWFLLRQHGQQACEEAGLAP